MNPRRLLLAALGLGSGLLFYLVYRDDQVVSNRLIGLLCGPGGYAWLKTKLGSWLPALSHHLQGCVPSALWCIIGCSLVGGWRIRLTARHVLPLAGLPPVINAWWEFVQWVGWTDGHAARWDILAGLVGWALVQLAFLRSKPAVREISLGWDWRLGVMLASFACMGLADVWR